MDEQQVTKMLDQLRDGEVEEIHIKKDDFLLFRPFLVTRPDFKRFRGIAQRGGDVVYHYLDVPRS
ncbi:hypothetical protein [Priestia koreensis]|uniref:hypothetical protein n=1 Tax=Priestia koreensis TaxID=284581 RepID=UPI001F59AEAF|nr:hypothetical protein [Priestia koreensis]MCM3003087.1 hypothetical protein [Priestia koreensis]UNL85897.1 hypothetical protein IE339_05155 [Priestia koreensis]